MWGHFDPDADVNRRSSRTARPFAPARARSISSRAARAWPWGAAGSVRSATSVPVIGLLPQQPVPQLLPGLEGSSRSWCVESTMTGLRRPAAARGGAASPRGQNTWNSSGGGSDGNPSKAGFTALKGCDEEVEEFETGGWP